MPIEFNADSGHLRLDRPTFQQLADWLAAGGGQQTGAGSVPAQLREAGVMGDRDQLHPAVESGFAAVANPVCRLMADLRDGQGTAERGDGWVGGDATALLLDLPGGRCEFGVVHPTFLPAMLGRIVGLGPRPRLAAEPVPADPVQIDRLTDPDPSLRAAAAAELPAPSLAELRRDWRIQASWQPGDGSPGVRALRVLDTLAGLWLVEAHQERVMLFPTTSTVVWRSLVGLLPTDAELPTP